MSSNTKHWLIGVIRAVTTGGSAGGTSVMYDVVTDHGIDWRRMLAVIVIPAGIRMFGYLKRHPFPGLDIPDDATQTVEISKPLTIVPTQDKTGEE